ncbi:MAG: sulfatase, partial [Deltaproteobacteria bacterium]|nr:sulfatase [Deltaproteobacteria bacterium]
MASLADLSGSSGMRRFERAIRSFRGVCLAALLAVGCGAEPRPPNFLFILVDTLRTDHLSAYGYERETSPALSRLVAGGVRFDRAYAAAPWTKPSVASMFTGQYPHRHGVNFVLDALPPEAVTVAERLSEAGYSTAGTVSHIFVAGKNGLDQGFDHYDSAEAGGHSHISTTGVTRRAIKLLEGFGTDPFFLFVHYFDPHYEYRRHPEFGFAPESVGRLRGGEDIHDLRAMGADLSPEEVRFLRDVYDEEVRFTDDGIGVLLASLEAQGLADDTIVIVAADHGEEFFERGWLGHTRTVHEEVIRVPLVVRVPGDPGPGRVVTTPISLASLAPTILDFAGIVAPDGNFQVASLRPLLEGVDDAEPASVRSEVRYVVLNRSNPQAEKAAFKYALIRDRYKLIKDFQAKRFELYDLFEDPGE